MPIRKTRLVPGEYYHVYHRGNYKQEIFQDEKEYIRFLFILLYFQSPLLFDHFTNQIQEFYTKDKFKINQKLFQKIIDSRYVELVSFSLMPNHFHSIIKEKEEGGISKYMERILKSHTKYSNIKHEKVGHLFQGPFQSKHIPDNNYLLHLSAYIHRNPRELIKWSNNEENYPWSSYQDYTKANRWGELLKRNIILEQFKNGKDYKKFLNSSSTKIELDIKSPKPGFV